MNEVTIIGTVVNDIDLSKTKENKICANIFIRSNDKIYKAHAFNELAVKAEEKLKKNMIVCLKCELKKFIFGNIGKYHDVFKLEITSIKILYEDTSTLKQSKEKEIGLNGKQFPF